MKQILILLIIFLAIRYFRKRYLTGAPRRGQDSGPGVQRERRPEGEEMVLDPVCDSYIPLSSAITARTGSGTEYFCSEECRDKFLGS